MYAIISADVAVQTCLMMPMSVEYDATQEPCLNDSFDKHVRNCVV